MTALLIAAMILALLLVQTLRLMARRRQGATLAASVPEPMRRPRAPHGLFLDPAHTWVRLHSDGNLRIGIDDFLADALGELEGVEAASPGSRIARGAPLLSLRLRGGRKLALRAPAEGEVVAVNQTAVESPSAIASDPYGVGWLVSLWPRDHKQAIAPLFIGAGASAFLLQELQRLADLLGRSSAPSGAAVMADGGVPIRGAVSRLSDADLELFERQFLGGEPPETPPR